VPALPSPGAIIQLKLNFKVYGDLVAMTRHFFHYTSGAPSGTDLTTMASDAVSTFGSAFSSLYDVNTSLESATATDLSSAMGHEATAGTPVAGALAGGAIPPAAAAVVAHSIARRYRGGHPRTYLPLGDTSKIATSGTWSSGFVSAVDSAWGTWANGMLTTFGSLVVDKIVNVSYYGPPNVVITNPVTHRARTVSTLRTTPIVDDITGHSVNPLIGSQRRRNRDA
jgi:hypothetical protein